MIVSIAHTACWDTSLGVGGWGWGELWQKILCTQRSGELSKVVGYSIFAKDPCMDHLICCFAH